MNQKANTKKTGLSVTLFCRPVWPVTSSTSVAMKSLTNATKHIVGKVMAAAVLIGLAASAGAQTVAYTADPVNTPMVVPPATPPA